VLLSSSPTRVISGHRRVGEEKVDSNQFDSLHDRPLELPPLCPTSPHMHRAAARF
jgi:hypothetical protein